MKRIEDCEWENMIKVIANHWKIITYTTEKAKINKCCIRDNRKECWGFDLSLKIVVNEKN